MKKLCQDKRIKERSKKILPLLQAGKTVREVAELLGYASPNSVYCYIHKYKLWEKTEIAPAPRRGRPPLSLKTPKPPKIPKPPKSKKSILPPRPKRSAQIVPLFLQGKTVDEIQEILHYKACAGVYNNLRRHNLPVPARPRGRKKKIKQPVPQQQPLSPPVENIIPVATRISLRQRARRIIPLYRQGKRSRGSLPVWIYPSKTSFTICNFTALSTRKAEIQPIIFFLCMSSVFLPKKSETFLAV